MPDFGDHVDRSVFDQILEMDDSETERDFSTGLVLDFFEQAEKTFVDMHNALEGEDLDALGSLGHFLKGSSATLGFCKIRDNCETIQKYGKSAAKREADDPQITDKARLEILTKALADVRTDTTVLEGKMKVFFGAGFTRGDE